MANPIRDRIIGLRRVQAKTLLADPRNWRRHSAEQRNALAGVLQEIGYADVLLAREAPDGLRLIDGHLRAALDPVPARQVVPFNGQKFLGFEWRDNGNSFQPGMEAKLVNPEVIAGMLAFDVFVCNRDRHAGNIIFQRPSPNLDRYSCILIDHSHALIGPLANFAAFQGFLASNPDPDAFLGVAPPQLKAIIQTLTSFDPWTQRIEGLTRTQLSDSIARLPSEWIPPGGECQALIDFLVRRKDNVRTLVRTAQHNFPSLRNGGRT